MYMNEGIIKAYRNLLLLSLQAFNFCTYGCSWFVLGLEDQPPQPERKVAVVNVSHM